jgi:hypothetical protein
VHSRSPSPEHSQAHADVCDAFLGRCGSIERDSRGFARLPGPVIGDGAFFAVVFSPHSTSNRFPIYEFVLFFFEIFLAWLGGPGGDFCASGPGAESGYVPRVWRG